MSELIDVRDEHGNLTGETMAKLEVHRTEKWHGVILVWIYNSQGQILVQRRAAHLNAFPEMWDVTVSGHLINSEKPRDAAIRQLSEELGIYAQPGELEEAGMLTDSFPLVYGKTHNECDYLSFLCKDDIKASELRLQAAEVLEVRWLSADDLNREMKDPDLNQEYAQRNPQLFRLAIDKARQLLPAQEAA